MPKISTLLSGTNSFFPLLFSALYCTFTAHSNAKFPLFIGIFASSEVVGYDNTPLQSGGAVVGARFLAINSNEVFDINDFKPTGEDAESVSIQTLTDGGATDKTYNWDSFQNVWYETTPGSAGDNAVGVTIKQGSGFWVNGDSSDQFLQSSGKVAMNPVEISLKSGGTLVINPFLEKVDINKFVPTGDGFEEITLQTLTPGGATDKSYNWDASTAVWYDVTPGSDGLDATGIYIDPGKGIFVWGGSSAQLIVIDPPTAYL